jgi:hypothetical protein
MWSQFETSSRNHKRGQRVRAAISGDAGDKHAELCGGMHESRRKDVHSRNGRGRIGTANRITQSWLRCFVEYRLDPRTCEEPTVVLSAELQEHLDRRADVQAVAEVEPANLYQ